MKRLLLFTVVLAFALSTSAFAQGNSGNAHGKGHGKGNPHNTQRDDDHDNDRGRGNSANRRDDDDRWERRGGFEYRTYDQGQRPPGWSKGKKTGWGNCDLPPGQAKKYGCNSYSYQGRTHYWYQDDQGRIIVRRPVITIGVH